MYPTWADRAPEQDAELRAQEQQQLAEDEALVRTHVLDLERHAQRLEQELGEVRAQQQELEHSLHRQHERLEIQRLELEAHHRQFEQNRARQMMEIEWPLRELLIEAEASEARGDLERAAKLSEMAAELETQLGAVARENSRQQLDLDRRMDDLASDRVREKIEALIEAGELHSAREAERELAEALVQRELGERRQLREDRVRVLQEELELLTIRLRRLEAEGTD